MELDKEFKSKIDLIDLYNGSDRFNCPTNKRFITEEIVTPNPIRPEDYGGGDNLYEARKIIKAHSLDFFEGNVVRTVLKV